MSEARASKCAGLLCAACLLLWIIPASAASGPQVIREDKHDVSAPLRDLAKPIPLGSGPMMERPEHAAPPLPFRVIPGPDPVIQNDEQATSKVPTTTLFNFDVMNGQQAGRVIPPDTNGAVGNKQFVITTNFAYAVYDKTNGNLILGPTFFNNIFKGFGGQCETNNGGDPVVLFDHIANRWLVEQLEYFTSDQMCVAVSKTDDATGSYNRYAFTFSGLPDYPKMAVWPDAYYLSFNFFGAGFGEPCAMDRTAMLAGNAATMVCFPSKAPNFGFLPSDLDGSTLPPTGAPNHFVELGSTNTTLSEFDFHVDFANPNNSTFTGPNTITVKNYTKLCGGGGGACIPQPSGGSLLDAIGNETMFRNAYRNFGDHESMVFSHSVAPGGTSTAVSAERWYELRSNPPGGSFSLYQSGTFQSNKKNFWMGSIAMDKMGNAALGYSADDNVSVKPSIRFTGRLATDAKNKMRASRQPVAGVLVQSGSNRWGDYSSMSVDPTDDCTFWYTQEYGKNGGTNWEAHVVAFKFNACN